jgi:hypothetical protein
MYGRSEVIEHKNGTGEGKLLNIKCILIFLIKLSEQSLNLRRIEQYVTVNLSKVPTVLVR